MVSKWQSPCAKEPHDPDGVPYDANSILVNTLPLEHSKSITCEYGTTSQTGKNDGQVERDGNHPGKQREKIDKKKCLLV